MSDLVARVSAARDFGYSDEEIDGFFAGKRQEARGAGYSDREVDEHLGFAWGKPLVGDGARMGRFAVDPGRVTDVFNATSHLATSLWGSIRKVTTGESQEPSDIMAALSVMGTGVFRAAAGEAGIAGGKLLQRSDAKGLAAEMLQKGKTNKEIAEALNERFAPVLDDGSKVTPGMVSGHRHRGTFELGAMGGKGYEKGDIILPGDSLGPKRNFTTEDVVNFLKEIGAEDIKVRKAATGGTEYVKFRPPGNPTRIDQTPVTIRIPHDPLQHVGLPPKPSEAGNLFDTGVHVAANAKKPVDPKALFNEAGGTFSVWENLEAAIKWRASVGRDGQFLIAPDQAPFPYRTRAADVAHAPKHPIEGADFHPDQLKLLAAGEEIPLTTLIQGELANRKRAEARRAGYSDEEIDTYLGKQAKHVPKAFLERFVPMTDVDRAADRVNAALIEEGKKGFGDQPFGIEAGGATEKWFQDIGLFRSDTRPGSLLFESFARPAAVAIDAVARSFQAGVYGFGGAVGKVAEEFGMQEGEAGRLKKETQNFGNWLMLQAGNVPPIRRITRDHTGAVIEEAIGGLPTGKDFTDATRSLAGGAYRADIEAKLQLLYEHRGMHPAEVVADAATDPVLRARLLSRGDIEPTPVGADVVPGGGGKPPGPPGDPPGVPGAPGEPPRDNSFRRTGTSDSVRLAEDAILDKVSVGEGEAAAQRAGAIEMGVDKLFPLKEAARKAEAAGVELEAADNPYVASRLYSGWAGKAEVSLKYDGPFDFYTYEKLGPSLKEILAPVKAEMRSFRAFAVAARAAELENLKGVTSGIDMTAARTVVEAAPQRYKDALLKTVDFMNAETRYYRDAGMLSRNGYEAMVEANKLYIPWHRVFEEEGIGVSPLGASLQPKQIKKRIEGSERDIIDPIESVIRNTFMMKAIAERNVVASKLVNMLRAADNIAAELKHASRELVGREETLPEGSVEIVQGLRSWGYAGNVPETLETMLAHVAAPLKSNEIRVFEDGRPTVFVVDEGIARAIKNLDRESIGMLERMMAPLASTLRAGAVMTPDFWARHLFRENFYALTTYDKGGVYTPLDQAKGLAGMVVHDPDFIKWMKGGGGHVSLVALDRNYMQENLRTLTADTGLMTRAWNVVRHPLTPLQAGTEIAMSATHFGAFKKRLRALEAERLDTSTLPPRPGVTGPVVEDAPRLGQINPGNLPERMQGREVYLKDRESVIEGMKAFGYDVETGQFTDIVTRDLQVKRDVIDAAWVSRDTSIDNTRIGSKMQAYNMIAAFANAKVQDTARGLFEAGARNPGRYAITVAGGIIAPSALLWYANKDDSRYQDLAQWQKDLFWIIPTDSWQPSTPDQAANRPADQIRINSLGQLEVNNGTIIRLPKPFLQGVLFGSGTERMLEAWAKENPRAFNGYFGSLMESTVGDLVPTAVVPVLEQSMNRSRFSGNSLIPGSLEKLLPEYQYTPYTTELSKKLGMMVAEFPGINKMTAPQERGFWGGAAAALSSPMLIENYVRGWTGTLGVYAMQAADKALQKAGVIEEPSRALGSLADVPIVRAFVVRYPTASVQPIQDFYSDIGETKRLHDTWMAKAKQGDLEAVDRIGAIGGDRIFKKFDGIKEALHTHTQLINLVNMDPSMPPAEKRQLIDGLYFAMHQIAKAGRDSLDDIKAALKEKPQ